MEKFPKKYEPRGIEEKWYEFWLKKKLFTPNLKSKKPSYTIAIPPPNVTGRLTLGHILNNSEQDILIRYKKLTNNEVLWIAGMDHAGIATQVRVETEKLLPKGIKKEDMGREKFVKEVWKWKEKYSEVIRKQLKKMGCALDWSRECFTLSDDYSDKVIKVFVDLYKKGLIYRGEYIINWCPRCLTALSDEQVETEELNGKLYYIRYPIAGTNYSITVATTRPETMLGDTGICVNPNDKRYSNLVGKQAILPIMERKIRIIADDYVDPDFGTGVLKVTPSHDPFDFNLAKKHSLEYINIMNPDATLNRNAKQFKGLDRYSARKKIITILKKKDLLEKTENYKLPLAKCERCDTAIEPRISKQWFVRMKPLAEPALHAVKTGKVNIFPRRWTNLYNHWLENVRDWCISRQLWWGHRIPVYYCKKCFKENENSDTGIIVSAKKPRKCPDCGSTSIYQDKDVLDTWFSSWLWPFATLGWPKKTRHYRHFYPTQTLITGWDIIYLWVARMIMAGIEFTGQEPFQDVVFHPMIRDERGRKMSKSLGNSPEPMDLIDRYGADALRYGLLLITPREQDVLFSEKAIDVGRKFCNKLWNASRLIYINHLDEKETLSKDLTIFDAWILREFNKKLKSIKAHYNTFELNAIAKEMYDFIWHIFCDWYLEIIKICPSRDVSKFILKQILIILHPYIPFITEEIHDKFDFNADSILNEKWPARIPVEQNTANVQLLIKLIEGIRNIRGLFNIKQKQKLAITISTNDDFKSFLRHNLPVLSKLGGIDKMEFDKHTKVPVASIILPEIKCFIKLSGIDIEKERKRLKKEIEDLSQRIDEIKYRLNNPKYIQKASTEVKMRENQRLENFLKKKEGIQKAIKKL